MFHVTNITWKQSLVRKHWCERFQRNKWKQMNQEMKIKILIKINKLKKNLKEIFENNYIKIIKTKTKKNEK